MAKVVTMNQMEACMTRAAALKEPMAGATASDAGASGMVPAPSAGDGTKFLRGDGKWASFSETAFIVSDTEPTGNVAWIKPIDLDT